ncbi:MAG: O-antigen ligase family protein [Vicinamibacterales bacterium]
MQRALLLLLIAVSYLLFAGGPAWTSGPLLALAAATVAVAPRRTLSFPRVFRPLDLALGALIAGIVLQIIPLPPAAVAVLSPHAATVRTTLDISPLGAATPTWTTLSLDAAATVSALGPLMLGTVAFVSTRSAFPAGGSRQFCRWLALIGAAAALLALYHRSVATGLVLGVLRPEARSANPFGAFVNRNHFGAWLLMMSAPVAGYLVAHVKTHPGYRTRGLLRESLTSGGLLVAVAGMMMVGALLLTVSRSSLVGLAAAVGAGALLAQRRLHIKSISLRLLFAGVVAAVLIGVLFVDLRSWAQRIDAGFVEEGIGASRRVIWAETVPIVRDFPITGTGAGTFSPAMVVYQQTRLWVGSVQRWSHFNNAHSHYLQVAAEGGLLLALPAAAGLILLFALAWRAINGDRGEIFWVRAGAAAGLAGVAVQSIWEVPLVMPANAIVCGVLAGLVLHQRGDHGAGDTPRAWLARP